LLGVAHVKTADYKQSRLTKTLLSASGIKFLLLEI